MKDFVKAIAAAEFDAANLTGGYDQLWAAGLPQACFLVRVVNLSNTTVELSYDGIDTHEIVPADTDFELNFQAGSQPNGRSALLAKGSRVSLLGQAGQGYIYFIGYYQET